MPIRLDDARAAAADALALHQFYSRRPLAADAAEETLPWELFQGRLLPPGQTRRTATFFSFRVRHESGLPSLSVKLDAAGRTLHVVRELDGYAHEAIAEGNVIRTREVRRPVAELIATFRLDRLDSLAELREELAGAVGRAVAGARLPLSPDEAPSPAFSFGELGYLPDAPRLAPAERLSAWLASCPPGRLPRVLELWVRASPGESIERPEALLARFRAGDGIDSASLLRALRAVFDDVSLSPWTDFVPRVVRLLGRLEALRAVTAAEAADFESSLLRLVCRHLTAYDLVTFHHRGANYPDALLLDAVLDDLLQRLQREPALFAGDGGRPRRRALRQAYLLRRQYEGHPVPDAPTSPGERQRALPEPRPRVPEEQLADVAARRRRLFAGDPLAARLSPAALAALRQSVADLADEGERLELGAAVFLDRPFNGGKAPVEPDATPLLASLAHSATVAARRLRTLRDDLGVGCDFATDVPGLSLAHVGAPARPGTVSLSDAARAAPDFVLLHTLPGSVRPLSAWIDFGPLADRLARRVLLARSASGPTVVAYDEARTPFAELTPDLADGYVLRGGVEYPARGVAVAGHGGGVRLD